MGERRQSSQGDMKRLWRNNGLPLVLFALFVAFLAGQSVAGWCDGSEERTEHGQAPISLGDYLTSDSEEQARCARPSPTNREPLTANRFS